MAKEESGVRWERVEGGGGGRGGGWGSVRIKMFLELMKIDVLKNPYIEGAL